MRYSRIAALGFAGTLILALAITALALYGLRSVLQSEARAREHALTLVRVEELRYLFEQKVASNRGYLLTGDQRFLDDVATEGAGFDSALAALNETLTTSDGRQLLTSIASGKAKHDAAFRAAEAGRGRAKVERGGRRPEQGNGTGHRQAAFRQPTSPARGRGVARVTSSRPTEANVHDLALDKLTVVLGEKPAIRLMAQGLAELGVRRLSTLGELYRLGEVIVARGGFEGATGSLLMMLAVMKDDGDR